MRTVLIVDDERLVLDGLAMALRKHRHTWHMRFASSHDEAVAMARETPPDAVVSDIRMPGPGGAHVLAHFREHHPAAVRLALTGHAGPDMARALTGLAHRFLSKPCPPETIYETVERMCQLRDILESPSLRLLVGRIGHLPAMPQRYLQLLEMLERSDANAARIAGVIEGDPAVAARVLHVVNSGFFGRSYSLQSLEHAVAFLGFDLLQSLVLSMELLGEFTAASGPVNPDAVGRHALLSARIARQIAMTTGERAVRGESRALMASTAALLHSLGILVLNCRARDTLVELIENAEQSGRALTDVERERLGTTHDHVGAYLLGLWGFPTEVVESIAYLHADALMADFDQLNILQLATGLAAELVPDALEDASTVDRVMAAAENLGIAADLDVWRANAHMIHAQLRAEV